MRPPATGSSTGRLPRSGRRRGSSSRAPRTRGTRWGTAAPSRLGPIPSTAPTQRTRRSGRGKPIGGGRGEPDGGFTERGVVLVLSHRENAASAYEFWVAIPCPVRVRFSAARRGGWPGRVPSRTAAAGHRSLRASSSACAPHRNWPADACSPPSAGDRQLDREQFVARRPRRSFERPL